MPKRDRFPHEAETEPGTKKPGTSGPAPKRKHSQSAPTIPPPSSSRGAPPSSRRAPTARPTTRTPAVRAKTTPKTSAIKKRKPHESDIPGATVDEVVADMSRDPRREKD
jgi:hypothetical protein